MKKFLFIAAVVALSASCSALSKMAGYPEVTAELNQPLAVTEEGELPVDFTVTIPSDYRNMHTAVLLYPRIQSDDSTEVVKLDSCAIDGAFNSTFNGRMDIYQADLSDSISIRYSYAPKGEDTKIVVCDTLDYKPWMSESAIYVDFWGESYGERKQLGTAVIKEEVTVPEPEEPEPEPVYVEVQDSLAVGYMSFKLGSYAADSLDVYMRQAIKDILADSTVVSVKAVVVGSCSPEGSEKFNNELANNRIAAVSDLLGKEGLTDIDAVALGVNWDMLYKWLDENDCNYIIDRLQKIDDPNQRYFTFRDKSYEVWRKARKQLFPSMRYAQVDIFFVKKTRQ